MKGLLNSWITFQQTKKVLFLSLLLAVFAVSSWVAVRSEIQAFPELTNVQVQIITQYPGKAAEEVERQITVPLEVASTGLPGLINQRSISLFGLSVITLTFDDIVKLKQARLDVFQRLNDTDLPDGVKPTLSPESTPVGEIFRYTVQSDLPPDEVRLIEDWTLEREFKSVPGVADVVSFGGPTQTIEVKLNLQRLASLGLTVNSVATALGQNHANAGGSLITHGEETFVVRSLGLYENPESLESAVVGTNHNIPIRIRDIGSVEVGQRLRLGQVGRNTDSDIIEGIILLRQGSDTLETCRLIREKIEHINGGILPTNTKVVPYYDRTNLIELSSHTVFHNIAAGILLVCLILFLSMGLEYWPLIFGVALIIPFALLIAFVGIRLWGYTPNLISLGAVDFGIIIETAIFAAEAVVLAVATKRRRDAETIAEALSEILNPALLCAFLLLVAFIPVLSLQRIEGRIFRPLGITLISALIGGQIGTFIFIPLFAYLIPIGPQKPALLDRTFSSILSFCERLGMKFSSQKQIFGVSALLFTVLLVAFGFTLGREFLPNLNEGALYIRATAPPTISRDASVDLAAQIRKKLGEIPEVTDVVSQIGRPDDGTDVNGFDNIEVFVVLTKPSEWKTEKTIDGFTDVAQKKLSSIEGVNFNFSQPIKDNVDEAISGVKGELVIKIFGQNIEALQSTAQKIAAVLKKVPGAEDVAPEQLMNQPELRFKMNRDLLARYGLRVTDAEDVLETALMGKTATKMIDDQGRSLDVVVKPLFNEAPNENLLKSLPILTPEGAKIPLGDVSNPKLVEGVSRVYRESRERRIAVKCSVRNRAVVEFVRDANIAIAKEVVLPPKFRIEWSGSFENAKRAADQLMFVVPLCVLAMIIILYTWFSDWSLVGLILWEIPFSTFGGLLALHIARLHLSISAAAGGIVLMGVSFLTAMMLVSDWNKTGAPWVSLKNVGRAILVSNGVAIVGLIPAAFSHGIGSETAKPFAVMILGGLVTSLFFSLTLLPAFLTKFGRSNG